MVYLLPFWYQFQTGINSNSNTSNGVYQMLINSFENQTNLAEWFEHRNHYSVVVTRHKDLKRTEYKIQKNDYVYDMLKVKGSVTALVTCANSLADNFSPTVTTDNKSELVGVVDSVGEALCPCGFDGCDNDCNYDKEATLIGRVDKICKDCGYPDDYCICDTCADCGVITKLVGGHTQCPRCYDFSKQPLVKTYSKTKTEDPANYRHEVRYAAIDDAVDDIPV